MSKELLFIRHAPISTPGRLCGRTDVAADLNAAAIAAVRAQLPDNADVTVSPALRCQQTAKALFPKSTKFSQDSRLWEQDFGDHDGLEFREIPDIGQMEARDLARYAPPRGESFADLCDRVQPVLGAFSTASDGDTHIIVAHAGTVRAALSWCLGDIHLGLAFEIAPLSVTRLRVDVDGPVSIISTNTLYG